MVISQETLPGQFDTRERQRQLHRSIRRPRERPVAYGPEEIDCSIVDRFERMVEILPDHRVLRSADSSVTYTELNRTSNRVAHALLESTGGEARPVGLLFDHGVEMVCALMGVLKSGSFYVPLDPTYPEDRLRYMAGDSGLETVITNRKNLATASSLLGDSASFLALEDIPADTPDTNPGVEIHPDAYAYLLYTSGSTGKPKGVIENHRDVKWFTGTFLDYDWIAPDDVVSGFWSLSFSGLSAGLYISLLGGASLLLVDPVVVGTRRLLELIRSHGVTILNTGPPLFRRLFEDDEVRDGMPRIRVARFGGSGADRGDIENFFKWAPESVLRHSFGASEIKHVCSYILTADSKLHGESMPIGYPVDGIEVLLLDENGTEVPEGQPGEIVIRSRYVCPGYWKRSDLNAERFSGDEPGGPDRFYRTGDLGLRDSNGCLFHRGRKDFQVKVRGFRIELLEVEERLKAIRGIRDAAVVSQSDGAGDTALVAFLIGEGELPDTSSIRQELSRSLPYYMMPGAFVEIEKMPETQNGKLDRNGFPEVKLHTGTVEHSPATDAPSTDTERRMVQIWEDALQRQGIGVQDDYFDIGGDSLMAAVIFDQVFRVYGKRIEINALFEAPTISELSALIDRVVPESTPVVPIRPSGSRTPIFCFHSLGGSVLGYYGLAKYLPGDYPVWAIQPRGVDGREKPIPTIPEMARYYASVISRVHESGPFIITGISLGGMIAFEVARELAREGRSVEKLVIIDSNAPLRRKRSLVDAAWDSAKKLRQELVYLPYDLRGRRLSPARSRGRIYQSNIRAARLYRNSNPQPVRVPTAFMRSEENGARFVSDESIEKWRRLTQPDLEVVDISGAHVGPENYVLDEPNVGDVAARFLELIRKS